MEKVKVAATLAAVAAVAIIILFLGAGLAEMAKVLLRSFF